jgi:hypothetical protein
MNELTRDTAIFKGTAGFKGLTRLGEGLGIGLGLALGFREGFGLGLGLEYRLPYL